MRDLLLNLFDPAKLELQIEAWGWLSYPILFAIVFAETGVLAGFFFPGDSLLFVAGFVASLGYLDIVALNVTLIVAAIVGDAFGFYLGMKTGRKVFLKPDSWLFKKEYLAKTQAFYEKHGGKTIILARFVPIVRTFAPFLAGVAGMNYRRFATFNIIGGISWVVSMTLLGYVLGSIPYVRANLEKAVILVVIMSILPMIVEFSIRRFRTKET